MTRSHLHVLVGVAALVETIGCGDGNLADRDADTGSGCSSATCDGCCDEAGTCRTGREIRACGARGGGCTDCLAAGELCSAGACEPYCGDGVRGGDEDCDGLDLGGETCESRGSAGGELRCDEGCRFDMFLCDCDPGGYPLCDGDVLVSCRYRISDDGSSGYRHEATDCSASGELCYETIDVHDGERHGACVPPGTEACDVHSFVTHCDLNAIVDCLAANYVFRWECDDDDICVDLGHSMVCLDEGAASCDPGTFVERCEAEGHVLCIELVPGHPESGGAEFTLPCDTCVETAEGIRCT